LFPEREFPRMIYHATKAPKTVLSAQEEADLGPEWSRVYIHQDYPTVKYHWTKKPVTVKNSAEEAALGGGWASSRGAFEAYQGPRLARTAEQDPVKWLDEWSVPGLSSEHRKKIKAQLLRADGTFERSQDPDSAALSSMRQAFDAIANVLFEARILTADLLRKDIPQLIWDSAIAGGWWRLASETRQDIFPEQLGRYWVWRDDSRDWKGLFRAEAGEWEARLLEAPSRQEPADPAASAAAKLRTSALPVRKPVKRNARNKSIDSTLQEIAEMRPHNHEEVFRALERRVRHPQAEPFVSAGGWLVGFQRNRHQARSWLSKAWSRLELPPFPRGPK
jgi:hypothetical protein